MTTSEPIINKVAQSGLITFDLSSLHTPGERVVFDMKEHLFQGLILREKDFRAFVKEHDWAQYQDALVAVTCSTDAIIPTWAYMLLASRMQPYAREVIFGDENTLETVLYRKRIDQLDMEQFKDGRIMIKGCADIDIPESAFIYLTMQLTQTARSVMYGEACSSVPVFKRKA